ncbi:MAG TPA: LLM class flavin-dependent oxidoreductase [Acidimicrobiales bacterium]|nr:LLM class flavin-dependent oxidoreductase [Acidimicrobiales bacterium]
MRSTAPFAAGSVSLRLYPHNELDAGGIIRELCDQATLGLSGGFDGIMTSEHHGGFAGYLPNPLQMSSFILEENETGWVAPCPVILPLRPVAQLAEEVAWLDARHPGRVGLGVAAGALPLDFDAMGVPLGEAVPLFKAGLPRIVDLLRGRNLGALDGDRALAGCASSPVPVLSAAASTAAARRAAGCGAGILTEGMSSVKRLRTFCDAYDAAGGTGSKVIIRRVWMGEPKAQLVADQRAVYQSYAKDSRPAAGDETIVATDPAELTERLYAGCVEAGGDAINLRIHLPGITPAEVREQITLLTGSVLPGLRNLMAQRRESAGA